MNLSDLIERNLIIYCAPTLASLKTASLFTLGFACHSELRNTLHAWNRELGCKGVYLTVLQECNNRALIYVFRKNYLQRDLCCPHIKRFLENNGYENSEPGKALFTLKDHLKQLGDFPHEIGLFLGYPIGDVLGFIRNKGLNCECSGCWKVYCNRSEAEKTFERFKKCEKIYLRLWEQGRSVKQLTVRR